MTRSHENEDLLVKLQEFGYTREQVAMAEGIADAISTVAKRGSNLVTKLIALGVGR